MAKKELVKKEKGQASPKGSNLTFHCSVCGQDKPLDDMRFVYRFFPPLVVCRACEKKIQ